MKINNINESFIKPNKLEQRLRRISLHHYNNKNYDEGVVY